MISFADRLHHLLPQIIKSPQWHTKWLNTLSYLENCGARKIAACEHPTLVKEEMLKHASEEFRHAHYLKRQIERISPFSPADYTLPQLMGGTASLRYLDLLNLKTCRFLGLKGNALKEQAYLLVTYAIELRAEELYPIYDAALRQAHSKITVKSILLEEKEHLEEMRNGLASFPNGMKLAAAVSAIESDLCNLWLNAIEEELRR
jgi:hypothetical protein